MDRIRVAIVIVLTFGVLMVWPLIVRKFFPQQEPTPVPEVIQSQEQPLPGSSPADPTRSPGSPQAVATNPAGTQTATAKPNVAPGKGTSKPAAGKPAAPPVPATQAAPREISIVTPYSNFKISNRGAVLSSLILTHEYAVNGTALALGRVLNSSDGTPLELIPQHDTGLTGLPLSFRLPWAPEVGNRLNEAYFQVDGAGDKNEIRLDGDQKQQITFTYAAAGVTAKKTLTFYANQPYFDISAEVNAGDPQQTVEILIGPRIGDQTDIGGGGSYSTPPQIVAYMPKGDKVDRIRAADITKPFAKVTSLNAPDKILDIDIPLAGDVDTIKILAGDGVNFVGYARVTNRAQGGRQLTLDTWPQGITSGSRIAQGVDTIRQEFRWAGIVNRYFAMIAAPASQVEEIALTNVQLKTGDKAAFDLPAVAIPMTQGKETKIFAGPNDRELLAYVSPQMGSGVDLNPLISYGMFAIFIRPLVPLIGAALGWASHLFHNFGWGIVLVTVTINLILTPLRYHSSKKMKSAAKHQPRLKELQERMKKLKENPKKNEREIEQLQREQVDLMKEANPLGGCLPMVLQMPIFWSIFIYLTISLQVRQEPWILWVKDLSAPDPLKILPIIMCVTMIGSSILQPQPVSADPSQKMQRYMMTFIMPIVLTFFFFINAPSGLVLYWMVSNLAGVVIQYGINKFTTQPPVAVAGAVAAKAGPKNLTGARKQKELMGGAK